MIWTAQRLTVVILACFASFLLGVLAAGAQEFLQRKPKPPSVETVQVGADRYVKVDVLIWTNTDGQQSALPHPATIGVRVEDLTLLYDMAMERQQATGE